MSLRLIGDRVLVLPDAYDAEPDSAIIVPESVKDEQVEMSGTVAMLSRGPRCPDCGGPLRNDLRVGDRVMFAPNRGSDITYDGVRYRALSQDDILGIVEDE